MKRKKSNSMHIILDNGKEIPVKDLSLDVWRRFMAEFMGQNPNSGLAWDIMGCIRGPDSPSERPDMSATDAKKAYSGRRERKYQTVEVLRQVMFFGVVGSAARSHKGTKVILPTHSQRDHFDRHVERAAQALDIPVEIK